MPSLSPSRLPSSSLASRIAVSSSAAKRCSKQIPQSAIAALRAVNPEAVASWVFLRQCFEESLYAGRMSGCTAPVEESGAEAPAPAFEAAAPAEIATDPPAPASQK